MDKQDDQFEAIEPRIRQMTKVSSIINEVQRQMNITSSQPLEAYLATLGLVCESASWDGDKLHILISNPLQAHQMRFRARELKRQISLDLKRKVGDIKFTVGSKSR